MNRSDNVGELIAALAKAQHEFQPALKTSVNPAFNSKYADLATCIDAVRPALNKHGIVLMWGSETDVEHQTVTVTTALHLGEQFISHAMEAPATNQKGFNVQAIGTAVTYLRRYGLQALCGLASEDDDGNSNAVENEPIRKHKVEPINKEQEAKYALWKEAFDEMSTPEKWNENIVPIMKEKTDKEFIRAAAGVAKARGWTYDTVTGMYR